MSDHNRPEGTVMNRLRLELALLRARTPDRLAHRAARRLPRRVAYWAAIRVAAQTVPDDQEVPAYTVIEALRRW